MLTSDFLTPDFLLTTERGRELYHDTAATLPIIDFHCHLNAQELADDRSYDSVTQLWVAADPYKHRMMRMAGVDEGLITGAATDREKFDAWAKVLPQTLGSPLFHWSLMELKTVFGVDALLSPDTADAIWESCNEQLRSPEFSARGLLNQFCVEALFTSNDLGEDLTPHTTLQASDLGIRICPSPRDADRVDQPVLDQFEALGCRIADHSVEDANAFDTLLPLAREYARRSWVMQLHLGAERFTNTRLRNDVGPAGGFATMGMSFNTTRLIRFLDTLDQEGTLPQTLLFPLNPIDTASLATLTGSFAPQVRLGPAWWYNDHRLGMVEHLENLSAYGLLSRFIGMTTDSRSILSMVRHDYFRRILCAWVGEQVKKDLLPDDPDLLKDLVHRICYDNARVLFIGEGGN